MIIFLVVGGLSVVPIDRIVTEGESHIHLFTGEPIRIKARSPIVYSI
jgi:hypothetical protein